MCMLNALAHQSSMQELDLLNPQLDPRITFSRASTKTYFGSDGLLQTAANDVWPLEYDPITLKPIGRSVWEQRTNLLQDSGQFETSFWNKIGVAVTTGAAVALDGSMTARRVTSAAGASFPQIYSNNVSLTVGAKHTVSLDITPETVAGNCALRAYRDGTNSVALQLDFSGATPVGTLQEVGVTGSTFDIEKSGASRWRVSITFTPAIATGWGLRFYLSYLASAPSAASYLIEAAQLEAGVFASPRIINTGSQVTRAADAPVVSDVGVLRYNAITGCMYTDGYATPVANPANSERIAELLGTTEANRVIHFRASSGAPTVVVTSGNVGSAGMASPAAVAAGARMRSASRWKQDDFAASFNGNLQTDSSGAVPAGITQLHIGRINTVAGTYACAPIRTIRLYPAGLVNSELQALTA